MGRKSLTKLIMEKTIFQKIIDREIPATIVYEDEQTIAFLNIEPVTKGHILLITKEPYVWMTDVPEELVGYIYQKAKEIMLAMKKGLQCHIVQVAVMGEQVPHFHIHLIPREKGDTLAELYPRFSYKEGEKQLYADKIKSAL